MPLKLEHIRRAVEALQGRDPDACITVATPLGLQTNEARTYAGHIDVLIYLPRPAQEEPDTVVVTCGLSAGLSPGDDPGFELILEIRGVVDATAFATIARAFADFAFLPYNACTYLLEGEIFTAVLPPFERMTRVLVCPWLFDPDYQEQLNVGPRLTVHLAQAIPLFEQEAKSTGVASEISTLVANINDPAR